MKIFFLWLLSYLTLGADSQTKCKEFSNTRLKESDEACQIEENLGEIEEEGDGGFVNSIMFSYSTSWEDIPSSAPYGTSNEELSENVHLKYFNKLNHKLGNLSWDEGGQSIVFTHSKITLEDDKTFIPDIKTVFFVHGFRGRSSMSNNCENWVKNYISAGLDVQVICVNWENLARLGIWDAIQHGGLYVAEAKNCVDVGWWLGLLLQSLVKKTGLDVEKVQLVGYSLGAHAAGMMGRTFAALSGRKVARVTGLDPAGILFVSDAFGLNKYMIGRDSAEFVDIIHGNGNFNPYVWSIWDNSRYFGDLHALGHADFYPNGGMLQFASGCKPAGLLEKNCSHNRPLVYYLNSILDGPTGYPAYPCASAQACSQEKKSSETVDNHMGEYAIKPPGGQQKQYYLSITKNLGPNYYGTFLRSQSSTSELPVITIHN